MPGAYSADLRERVVGAVTAGTSRRGASAVFKVSVSTAIRWAQRFEETGGWQAKPTGGDRRSRAIEAHKDWLLGLVASEPDLTLMEIRGRLAADKTFAASVSTLWRFFDRHGISFKKTLHAAEQDREDVKAAREEWREKQPSIDPKRLVFIDETGTSTNMTRLRGRAPKGQRLIEKTPHGHWKLTTFIAALRHDQIIAPMVIDRPMNGEIFLAYVLTFLLPTLSEGDIVVMDNLAVHKIAGVAEAIEGVGARVLYLPPYSPDLNPIEQVFAKLKALLRNAKERTIGNLWDRIGKLLDEFSADECANYLTHSGYAST
jgi:transposase